MSNVSDSRKRAGVWVLLLILAIILVWTDCADLSRGNVSGAVGFTIGWGLLMLWVWTMHPDQQKRAADYARAVQARARALDAQIVCPHCKTRGAVRTTQETAKRGISGGKATAAVLTGGLSVLATGLSQKVPSTRAKCSNCGITWLF